MSNLQPELGDEDGDGSGGDQPSERERIRKGRREGRGSLNCVAVDPLRPFVAVFSWKPHSKKQKLISREVSLYDEEYSLTSVKGMVTRCEAAARAMRV